MMNKPCSVLDKYSELQMLFSKFVHSRSVLVVHCMLETSKGYIIIFHGWFVKLSYLQFHYM